MFRKERQPLKSFMVRHPTMVRITKFIKHARSICCELGTMFYTDLNRLKPGLIKVEGKTALLPVEKCCALYIPN